MLKLGPSHHQWRSRCSDFFWCVFGEKKKTSTTIHPVKFPHSNQEKWCDDFQHEPQSLWNPRRPFISLSLYNIRNIPKKHRLFVERFFFCVFFLVGEKPMALLLANLSSSFGPLGCGEAHDAVGEWRGGEDFPCVCLGGGRALRVVTFYPFYWVFPQKMVIFLCVILYIHFVTTQLKLKDIQSKA